MAKDSKEDSKKVPPESATAAEQKSSDSAGTTTGEESKPQSILAPPLPEGTHYIWGTGRRKKAVARVRIRPGSGNILINKRPMEEFFVEEKDRQSVLAPLETAQMLSSWDIWANVKGGGFTGQAGAVMLGLARALAKAFPDTEPALRAKRLLTRDARMKERKKYGQKGARKKFQFSKR